MSCLPYSSCLPNVSHMIVILLLKTVGARHDPWLIAFAHDVTRSRGVTRVGLPIQMHQTFWGMTVPSFSPSLNVPRSITQNGMASRLLLSICLRVHQDKHNITCFICHLCLSQHLSVSANLFPHNLNSNVPSAFVSLSQAPSAKVSGSQTRARACSEPKKNNTKLILSTIQWTVTPEINNFPTPIDKFYLLHLYLNLVT